MLDGMRQREHGHRSDGNADDDTQALAKNLSEKLGLRVSVSFNGKSGTLIMNYKTLDQLDEILRLLGA